MRSAPFYNFLLEATLCGGLMILMMLPVRLLMRKRLGSRAVYFAWLLVAVRLLTPLSLPNPAMNELRPTNSTNMEVRPIADQVRIRFMDTSMNIAGLLPYEKYRQSPARAFFVEVASLTYQGRLGKWLLYGYGGGALGLLLYMALKNAAFRRRLKKDRVEALSGEALQNYEALCALYKVKLLPVWYVDPLPGPCLVGAFRPYIALPLSMDPKELPDALRHELCHFKARDGLRMLLRDLCLIVHWFNPLVWLMAAWAREDCEMACDDLVTAKMDRDQRLNYAGALVRCAGKKMLPGLTVVATGMTMKGKRLKSRVKAIVSYAAANKAAVAAFALLCAVVLAVSFLTAEAKKAADTTEVFASLPTVSQRALRTDIPDEAAAKNYAEAFLSSAFAQAGSISGLEITEADGAYTATASFASGATQAALRFDTQGVVLSYDNTGAIGETAPSKDPFDDSDLAPALKQIMAFADRFMYGYLPGVGYESVGVTEDVTDAAGRYVTLVTGNANVHPAHRFVIQAEPELKVLAFSLLADKEKAVYDDPVGFAPSIDSETTLEMVYDAMKQEKGAFIAWTPEDKAALCAQLPLLMAEYKEKLGDFMALSEVRAHRYSLPGENSIAGEEAERIARHALAQEFALSQEDFSLYRACLAYYTDDPALPMWEVSFAADGIAQYVVRISAANGKVTDTFGPAAGRQATAPDGQAAALALSKEQAEALARQALAAYLGMEEDAVKALYLTNCNWSAYDSVWAYRGLSGPIWDVVFGIESPGHEDYEVVLDAQTGWILAVMDPKTIPNG